MKEKDLERNLDNLIIDGLIKEAEQDNADFEAAMRQMSEEEFEELIYEPAYPDWGGVFAQTAATAASELRACASIAPSDASEYDIWDEEPIKPERKKSKWQVFRPWITSAVAAAAVVLIVLIPSVNAMNDKLCESALYASQSYMTPSKGGFDVATASVEEVETELPNLITRYSSCIDELKRSRAHVSPDLQEAGWDLTLAYLRLHKKGDAVKVLKVLSKQFNGTPFGDHCQKMIDQL